MKWISIALLCSMIPACFAEVLVQQDFEDPTFPPAGWSADNFFPQMYWARVGDEFNYFAFCAGIVFIETHIDAPDMDLDSGEVLDISFYHAIAPNPPEACEVALYEGSLQVWSIHLTEEHSYDYFTLPPLIESGTEPASLIPGLQ